MLAFIRTECKTKAGAAKLDCGLELLLPAVFPDLCWRAWRHPWRGTFIALASPAAAQAGRLLLYLNCCSGSPNYSTFIDLCHVSFPLHPHASHLSNSLYNVRQVSPVEGNQQIPLIICVALSQSCARSTGSSIALTVLGMYCVLVMAYSALLSLSYTTSLLFLLLLRWFKEQYQCWDLVISGKSSHSLHMKNWIVSFPPVCTSPCLPVLDIICCYSAQSFLILTTLANFQQIFILFFLLKMVLRTMTAA